MAGKKKTNPLFMKASAPKNRKVSMKMSFKTTGAKMPSANMKSGKYC